MRRLAAVALAVALSGGALYAQTVAPTYTFLLVVNSDASHAQRTFEMSPGGCLRGPLRFFDKDGKIIFELAKGASFPSDCEAKP